MRYSLIVIRFISYSIALFSLFFGFGEIIVLYVMSPSIIPYAEGSGKSTFGLWFFLAVLIIGGNAGLLASISILRLKWLKLRIATLIVTFLAAVMSIIDIFMSPILNPLGITWIDFLYVMLCVSYLLCVIVDLKKAPEATKSTTAIG